MAHDQSDGISQEKSKTDVNLSFIEFQEVLIVANPAHLSALLFGEERGRNSLEILMKAL